MRNVRPYFFGLRPFRKLLDPRFGQRGILPRRLARAHAEHARTLDQQEVGAGKPNATGEADDEQPRAPRDAADAVFEDLPADGIVDHIRAAAVRDALDHVAERLAGIEHEMV